MKKLFIYSLLALSGFLLPACGDDEKKEDDPQPKAVDPAATHEGNWSAVKILRTFKDANNNSTGTPTEDNLAKGLHLMTLANTGAYSESFNNKTATGTYTRNDLALTLNVSQPLVLRNGKHYIDSLTTSRMVLRDTVINNGIKTITVLKLVR